MRVYRSTCSDDILIEDDDLQDTIVVPLDKVEKFIETLRKVANGEEVEENI